MALPSGAPQFIVARGAASLIVCPIKTVAPFESQQGQTYITSGPASAGLYITSGAELTTITRNRVFEATPDAAGRTMAGILGLGALQKVTRVFRSGLLPYEDFRDSESRMGDTDSEDTNDDEELSIDGASDSESSCESDPGALKRNRAFAEYEMRTFNDNVARRGWQSGEVHQQLAHGPIEWLQKQFDLVISVGAKFLRGESLLYP